MTATWDIHPRRWGRTGHVVLDYADELACADVLVDGTPHGTIHRDHRLRWHSWADQVSRLAPDPDQAVMDVLRRTAVTVWCAERAIVWAIASRWPDDPRLWVYDARHLERTRVVAFGALDAAVKYATRRAREQAGA